MSKSLGNVVCPLALASDHGVDVVRYFLLRDGAIDADADFSMEKLNKRFSADLANTLGNLGVQALLVCLNSTGCCY